MTAKFLSASAGYFVAANAIVLSIAAFAGLAEARWPDFYYFSSQEDEYVEWASFWAFMLAALVATVAACRYRRSEQRWPWYFVAIVMAGFLIAMEEISWGQRVLGYRPPVYFLEHNYQQELNFHNVVDISYRKIALQLAIAGYGLLLPLVAAFGAGRRGFDRLGIVAASPALVPAFLATLLLYLWYPWSFSAEWVELMFGCALLFSLLPALAHPDGGKAAGIRRPSAAIATATLLTLALGLATAAASRIQRDTHPSLMEAALTELDALKHDFESGRARSRCNLHKRLYTFMLQYDQAGLLHGKYAALSRQGLPAERAEFLLDPWNSPYWIRDRCDSDTRTRVIFVYSFGPNRRRDSTAFEIGGDDLGAYLSPR